MNIGINLLLWTLRPTVEHIPLIHKIKEYGYAGVEMEVTEMTEKDAKVIGEELKKINMGATSIMLTPCEIGDPTSESKKERDAALEHIKRCADRAALLGADVMGGPMMEGFGKVVERRVDKGPTEQEIDWVADTMRRAAEYAKTLNIKIAMEVVNRFEMRMANTVGQMMEIVRRADMDNLGLHVDTHHGNIEEANICKAWEDAADKIFLVHLSENHRGIPGNGPAITPDVFKTLKKIDYQGWATVEAFFLNQPDMMSARMKIWRKYAKNEEEIAVKGLEYIRQFV
ncbi:sugar phosphate isomerase/epimerase family protein [Ruminococcus bromii]|uniref:sugar phosphate isomerase/epimerase family protein n=1 Tax=Ruminococcus bromii TaxID=40518 RepID=UPI003FD82775